MQQTLVMDSHQKTCGCWEGRKWRESQIWLHPIMVGLFYRSCPLVMAFVCYRMRYWPLGVRMDIRMCMPWHRTKTERYSHMYCRRRFTWWERVEWKDWWERRGGSSTAIKWKSYCCTTLLGRFTLGLWKFRHVVCQWISITLFQREETQTTTDWRVWQTFDVS